MRLHRQTWLLLAVAAALALAACGSDEEGKGIPQATAADLQAQLDSIEQRFEFPGGAACNDITGGDDPNTTPVGNLIDSLPDDTDADLRDALRASFDRLFELVDQECSDDSGEQTDTTPETDTTPQTTTEQTETQPTETTPTETTDTETTPTETTTPDEGNQDGDGNDGGGGFGPGEGDE